MSAALEKPPSFTHLEKELKAGSGTRDDEDPLPSSDQDWTPEEERALVCVTAISKPQK